MSVFSMEAGNRAIAENVTAFLQEADRRYDQRLEEIALYIRDHHREQPVVLLSGPSGSGKTTSALIIEKKLDDWGFETHTLSMDDYFLTLTPEQHRLLAEEKLDLESPSRVDSRLLNSQLNDIIAGRPVELPRFDFHAHARSRETRTLLRKPNEIVILEGIHTLNPEVVTLPDSQTVRLYVSVRTRLSYGDTTLHPKWLRLMRRMLRDTQYRGRKITDTLQMFPSVQRGENAYIMPYKGRSTFDIDTFIPYEVNLYSHYLQEELKRLDPREYPEVELLLPALAQAAPLNKAIVPPTSLVREFIGDSVYY